MNHAALVRSELGEGMGHLWQAAGHAAGGMGGPAWRMARARMMAGHGAGRMHAASRMMANRGMGHGQGWQAMMPSLGAARRWGTKVAAMAPLAAVAPTGGALTNRRANRAMTKVIMKKESRSGRRRVGMLVGLLAAGVAAGAASAMAARRRNRMAWEEYETHGHGYTSDTSTPLAEPAYDPMGSA
jgi:hypothetical protein